MPEAAQLAWYWLFNQTQHPVELIPKGKNTSWFFQYFCYPLLLEIWDAPPLISCSRSCYGHPLLLTTSLSAVDPAIVVTHVVVRRCQRHCCLPSTPTSSLPTLSPMSSFATAAATAATPAVSAALAANFWLIVVCITPGLPYLVRHVI